MSGSEVEPIRKWSPHCTHDWKLFENPVIYPLSLKKKHNIEETWYLDMGMTSVKTLHKLNIKDI